MSANDKFHRIFGGRALGRTTAMMEGVKNQPNAVVWCATEQHASELRRKYPGVTIKSGKDFNSLLGTHKFVVPDHFYLEMLWAEREREVAELIEKLKQTTEAKS